MKGKPDIDKFLSGGAAAAAENKEPAAPAPAAEKKELVAAADDKKITKTFRLTTGMENRLKEAAFKRSVAAGKRVAESDIIEAALNTYLSKYIIMKKTRKAETWDQYSKRLEHEIAFSNLVIAYRLAGRAVVGWEFGRKVKSIQSCTAGGGKLSLPILDAWCPLDQCTNNKVRLFQHSRLRDECMLRLAAQATRKYLQNVRRTNFRDMEINHAIDLVEHVMSCPRTTAETFLTAYYIPAIDQFVREPRIWTAIEQIADAITNVPEGFLMAEEVNTLLAVILPHDNSEKEPFLITVAGHERRIQ